MMRIAIVGGGGFAAILAHHITQNANPVIILSREVSSEDKTEQTRSLRDGRSQNQSWKNATTVKLQ